MSSRVAAMKSNDMLVVDTAALQRPWSWCDGTLLWNEVVDHCVLSHGGTRWPITPENRAAIESAMNHMPALISLVADVERLKDAIDRAVDIPKMSQAIHSVLGSLARVHGVPPPSPSSPVAWDPDSGSSSSLSCQPASCTECHALARMTAVRRSPIGTELHLSRANVAHLIPVDCKDQIPLCEAVSVSTRIHAGTMDVAELEPSRQVTAMSHTRTKIADAPAVVGQQSSFDHSRGLRWYSGAEELDGRMRSPVPLALFMATSGRSDHDPGDENQR